MKNKIILLVILIPVIAFTNEPVASTNVGGVIYYYETLHEAIEAVPAELYTSDSPFEITLLRDITVHAPLIIEDNQHIQIVTANANRTIMRGADFLEYPVIWIRGENSSLTLGSAVGGTGLETQGTASGIYELVIDGGVSHGIEAHSPLVAINGPDSRLIMHDQVFLQNNFNAGLGLSPASYYQNGGAVFIRTNLDDFNRPAEFIMKGGSIRSNVNNIQNPYPYGGGVFVNSGIFTMEGGRIMDNSALHYGGGVYITNRGIFRKTGGIIYGNNASEAYRNIAAIYQGLKPFGHAVLTGDIGTSLFRFRNDTIGENEALTFTSTYSGEGIFGKGEKWHDQYTALRRNLLIAAIAVLVLGSLVIIFLRRKAQARALLKKDLPEPKVKSPALIEAETQLTEREKDVFYLLLSGKAAKEISRDLNLSLSSVNTHSERIYRKLNVHSRAELMVKYRS